MQWKFRTWLPLHKRPHSPQTPASLNSYELIGIGYLVADFNQYPAMVAGTPLIHLVQSPGPHALMKPSRGKHAVELQPGCFRRVPRIVSHNVLGILQQMIGCWVGAAARRILRPHILQPQGAHPVKNSVCAAGKLACSVPKVKVYVEIAGGQYPVRRIFCVIVGDKHGQVGDDSMRRCVRVNPSAPGSRMRIEPSGVHLHCNKRFPAVQRCNRGGRDGTNTADRYFISFRPTGWNNLLEPFNLIFSLPGKYGEIQRRKVPANCIYFALAQSTTMCQRRFTPVQSLLGRGYTIRQSSSRRPG